MSNSFEKAQALLLSTDGGWMQEGGSTLRKQVMNFNIKEEVKITTKAGLSLAVKKDFWVSWLLCQLHWVRHLSKESTNLESTLRPSRTFWSPLCRKTSKELYSGLRRNPLYPSFRRHGREIRARGSVWRVTVTLACSGWWSSMSPGRIESETKSSIAVCLVSPSTSGEWDSDWLDTAYGALRWLLVTWSSGNRLRQKPHEETRLYKQHRSAPAEHGSYTEAEIIRCYNEV